MPIENYDRGRDSVGNTSPDVQREYDNPGYETTDVNVGGVVVFLGGLAGFVLIFFVFCFVMGKVINNAFIKEDGPIDKWHVLQGQVAPVNAGGRRENLASNNVMQQRELQQLTDVFPNPRLQMDDGHRDLSDLHAREDLLLENYSTDNGVTRIPIERAMELVVQRGLPVVSGALTGDQTQRMAGDAGLSVTTPLTTGFSRTGYELDQMEVRAEKLSYGKAQVPEQAKGNPVQ